MVSDEVEVGCEQEAKLLMLAQLLELKVLRPEIYVGCLKDQFVQLMPVHRLTLQEM